MRLNPFKAAKARFKLHPAPSKEDGAYK